MAADVNKKQKKGPSTICKAVKGFLPGYLQTIKCAQGKERYLAKLDYLNGEDPYEIPKKQWKDDVDLWPSVTYIDVGMYLLFSHSPYTQEQLKNYKSLDCYQNFVNGWVREVLARKIAEHCLMIAKVNHSQRMSEKPLTPWVICEGNGKVLAAHCDCMAGLGESCSHVASLLWAVEAGARRRDSLTVTDKRAYWVLPSAVKTVPYAEVKDINFKKSAKHPNNHLSGQDSVEKAVPTPSSSELCNLFKTLSLCPTKPAILSLVKPYSDLYVPKSLHPDLPPILSLLLDQTLVQESYDKLLEISSKKLDCYNVTPEQQKTVENKTRDQADSRLWFRLRTGRVTASRFKAACHTNKETPSRSLIMNICYPELKKFSTTATKWGCNHEDTAKAKYEDWMKTNHPDVTVTKSGFWIHPEHGFLGASPDGKVECSCCGSGICEIKCPFCHKDDSIDDSVNDKNFCIEKTHDGKSQLKRTHTYYYQVQAQLTCTGARYCDFVVWMENYLFVERIYRDDDFLHINISRSREFVLKGILPELTGKWFSRPKLAAATHEQ